MRIAIIRKPQIIITLALIVAIIISIIYLATKAPKSPKFDGQHTYELVKQQVDFGPRTMGSLAHERAIEWIISTMQESGWDVEAQTTQISGVVVKNIIAKRGQGAPWMIIGSHYDSRSVSDHDLDPAAQNQPVPGANDGASSTAILIELGRVLPSKLDKQVWLVFFDDEDNGNASGAGWDIGANYFVSNLTGKPDSVVILDMVGDKNLNIYMEQNSDQELSKEIWGVAKQLGFSQFIPSIKYGLIDDHIPFLKAGIQAIDVIDFDYPYWHTTHDTLDKISAGSLKIVGDTILTWLLH